MYSPPTVTMQDFFSRGHAIRRGKNPDCRCLSVLDLVPSYPFHSKNKANNNGETAHKANNNNEEAQRANNDDETAHKAHHSQTIQCLSSVYQTHSTGIHYKARTRKEVLLYFPIASEPVVPAGRVACIVVQPSSLYVSLLQEYSLRIISNPLV